jgi:hypothetical protein
MDFFGRQLEPLWHKAYKTPLALLEASWANYTTTLAVCNRQSIIRLLRVFLCILMYG